MTWVLTGAQPDVLGVLTEEFRAADLLVCMNEDPESQFSMCTRPVHHLGRHIALGEDEHRVLRVTAAWPGDHEPTLTDLTEETR